MVERTYNSGPPPRRGAYRVKSDGPSPNPGWRYWDGERWGPLCTSFRYANKVKTFSRKTPLKFPVLWAGKGAPKPVHYTCIGKGGEYELLGTARGAGTCRAHGSVQVYRDVATGDLFYRSEVDFNTRMEKLP